MAGVLQGAGRAHRSHFTAPSCVPPLLILDRFYGANLPCVCCGYDGCNGGDGNRYSSTHAAVYAQMILDGACRTVYIRHNRRNRVVVRMLAMAAVRVLVWVGGGCAVLAVRVCVAGGGRTRARAWQHRQWLGWWVVGGGWWCWQRWLCGLRWGVMVLVVLMALAAVMLVGSGCTVEPAVLSMAAWLHQRALIVLLLAGVVLDGAGVVQARSAVCTSLWCSSGAATSARCKGSRSGTSVQVHTALPRPCSLHLPVAKPHTPPTARKKTKRKGSM